MKYKTLFPTLLLCISIATLFAQTPDGRLYVHTNKLQFNQQDALGYIEYPEAQYHFLDSVNLLQDMQIREQDHALFVAMPDKIINFGPHPHQLKDTLNIQGAHLLGFWSHYVLVGANQPPYFRMYDANNNYLLTASIDTTLMHSPFTDMVVTSDKAWLLFGAEVWVIDLNTSTIVQQIATPPPFQFGGQNTQLLPVNNEIYVLVDYATGNFRFSFLKIDQQTFAFDTIFHKENIAGPQKMLQANDRIFCINADSWYDKQLDSLIEGTFNNDLILAWDETSQALFRWNYDSKAVTYSIGMDTASSVSLPNILLNALFATDTSSMGPNSINNLLQLQNAQWQIYPNPTTGIAHIQWDPSLQVKRISIYAITGVQIHNEHITNNAQQNRLQLPNLPGGVYLIQLENANGLSTHKWIKN